MLRSLLGAFSSSSYSSSPTASIEDYLRECPFLTQNTFASNLEMERVMCQQQFWRREGKTNQSLGLLNQSLSENADSYQPLLQRAKWIPWWYQSSYFHKQSRKLAQADLDKALTILMNQKQNHSSKLLPFPTYIITLVQAWKHIVNANFVSSETLLEDVKREREHYYEQVRKVLNECGTSPQDERLYLFFSDVEPMYTMAYSHYYNSQYDKALREYKSIWKKASNTKCSFLAELPPELRTEFEIKEKTKRRKLENDHSFILNDFYLVKIPSMISQSYYHLATELEEDNKQKQSYLHKSVKYATLSIIMTRNYNQKYGFDFGDVNTYGQRENIYRQLKLYDMALRDINSMIQYSHPYQQLSSAFSVYKTKSQVITTLIEEITKDEAFSIILEKKREHSRLSRKKQLLEDIMKDLIRKHQTMTIKKPLRQKAICSMNRMEDEHTQISETEAIANPYLEICKCWNDASDKLETQADIFLFGYTGQYLPDTNSDDTPMRYPDTILNIEQAFLICDMRLDWALRNNQPGDVINKYTAHLGRLLHSTIYNKESCTAYELAITPTIFASWFTNKTQRIFSNDKVSVVEHFVVPEWFYDITTTTLREELMHD
ncbi:hypothetical protein C9374_007278 [Naegleria lovaniensis]|uniref:Uncharacterized protein n=1 Tax=Naegleria lovaniensis TaxID=51637 RepID=A0AA88H7H5_NAELO|nr:uncharacterized protein C9374_007278 [Naegleria lovaniensis]KAG2393747.1 hypothetical protein C9374_007278 [Naegleria lovaniensis]